MYVQATLFEDRTPTLPGDSEICWQGIGDDAGYAILFGSLDGGQAKYYISDTYGFSSLLTYDFTDLDDSTMGRTGTEDLEPIAVFPDSEWIGSRFRLSHDYKLIFTDVPQWHPREWKGPHCTVDWWTSDVTEFENEWRGDYWWQTNATGSSFVQHGKCTDFDPGDYTISMANTYTAWVHTGNKGTAPAGEYANKDDPTDIKTVGYWNDDDEEYQLNSGGEDAPPDTISVNMTQLGLLRVPDIEQYSVPSGWDFDGANWESPDPWDARYWLCIRWAMLERESVLTDRRMGTLVNYEDRLFQYDPNGLPTKEALEIYNSMLRALAGKYVDVEKVLAELQKEADGDPDALGPEITDCTVSLDGNADGGWVRGDILQPDNNGNLSEWLKNAKTSIEKMGFIPLPHKMFWRRDVGPFGWEYGDSDHGDTLASVYAEALAEYRGRVGDWLYSDDRPSNWFNSVVNSSFWGESSMYTDPDYGEDFWFASITNNIDFICGADVPPTSVIDGTPLPYPGVGYAVWSRNCWTEEVGDNHQNGKVVSNNYWSERYSEGVYWEWMPANGVAGMQATSTNWNGSIPAIESSWNDEQRFGDDAPSTLPHQPHPTQQGDEGYALWGNETECWVYLWYGDSFRFSATLPDLDGDDDDEDEEEEPTPTPTPEPEPEPSSLPSPKLDWYIVDGTENTVELKGPGPYRFLVRPDGYRTVTSRDSGETKYVADPNLRYHYPVMFYTRDRTVVDGKRAWWIYSRYEVPKLELDKYGRPEWVFYERPKVATIRKNPNGYTTSTIPMPTESYDERIIRIADEQAEVAKAERKRKRIKW